MKTQTTIAQTQDFAFFQQLFAQQGPTSKEYQKLTKWFEKISLEIAYGAQPKNLINTVQKEYAQIFKNPKTLFGHASIQPYGYAGDFEIIDKVYEGYISPNPVYQKWDRYFQATAASQAVRNRKSYFKKVVLQLVRQRKGKFKILNLASGSCRDLLELFQILPVVHIKVDCVEYDKNAIKYAKNLLGKHNSKISFSQKNILRYQPDQSYDLIWSAGLFDYFNDTTFVKLLNRFLPHLTPKGEMIIGNFHPYNPTKSAMEFMNWPLYYRTEAQLFNLALKSNPKLKENIKIEWEPLGINLFLRLKP